VEPAKGMTFFGAAARAGALLALAAAAAGCAASSALHRGAEAEKRKDYDQAVIEYVKALGAHPGETKLEVALARARVAAAELHFDRGRKYFDSGQLELAEAEFQQTIFLMPSNQYAEFMLSRTREELEKRAMSLSEIEAAKERARKRSLAPPLLNPQSKIPITLQFKDQPKSKIYDVLSKVSGVNFIYDDRVDLKQTLTVEIAGVSFEKAMDLLMLQGRDFYKVLDENTILIAPDQRQKRQEYEDRVLQTFFLSNGDTKQVNTVLRQLLDARKVAENPELNSITIKDSPDVVAVAQKIIEANDKAKAELVIDVELIELNRSKSQDLGVDLSSKGFSITFTGPSSLPLNNLDPLRSDANWSIGPIPSFVVSYAKSLTDAKVLAKPQLRVTDGEKAEIHIGDRVPIPTTTFNTSNTVGGNIVPVTSFSYQNVGIEISVEPRVHHNREITMKLNVKISAISGSVEGSGGVSQPIIGERQISTVVRLKDGETNLLSGLIREEDRHSLSGVPGLSDIPILNKLFGRNVDSSQKTDIVLTLTPHIVRVPDIREADLDSIWVGTEEQIKLRLPNRNPFGESPFAGEDADATGEAPGAAPHEAPAAPPSTAPAPAESGPPARTGASTAAPVAVPSDATFNDDEEEDDWEDDEDYEEDTDADASPNTPSLAQIILTTPKSIYAIGEQVVAQVRVANATNVGSIPFHLRYNQAVLEYTGQAAEGDFLNRDGAGTVFVPTAVAPGEIVVGASRTSSPTGANGAGILGTFTFVARAAGPAAFVFTGAAVKDPNANNLPASFSTAQIVVQPR